MSMPLETKYRIFCEIKKDEEQLKKEILMGKLRGYVEEKELKEMLDFFDDVKDELYIALCNSIKNYNSVVLLTISKELLNVIRKFDPIVSPCNFFKILGLNIEVEVKDYSWRIKDTVIEKLFSN